MGESPNNPEDLRRRYVLTDEDPHFHDDDETGSPEDAEPHPSLKRPTQAKAPRRLPPPPRRFYED